jgi:hypothetical protein
MDVALNSVREIFRFILHASLLLKGILAMYGIWQVAQLFGHLDPLLSQLDPLRGKWTPLPQVGAVLIALLTLGVANGSYKNKRRYPKEKLERQARRWLWLTISLFFLSFNLYYGLPETLFVGLALARWLGTMGIYWAFGGALAVTVTLANELGRNAR